MSKANTRERWTHGAMMGDATEALYRAGEAARREAHRVLQLPGVASPSASVTLETARAHARDYLEYGAPRTTRAVADLLGFSNLWRATTGRMRQLAAIRNAQDRETLAQGLRLLLSAARTRLELLSSLCGTLERLARPGVPPQRPDTLAAALVETVAAAQALHREWEALTRALDAAVARLESADAEASAWLADRLGDAEFGWNRAHATAQRLQREAMPPV
ncbi:hypothetical protein CYFUS_002464 [Cystobacter fuscus]|uniref:Uncharacterized protein n=1 Tax=Cystobacter fuscus TaxID=43 RepID=A0A250J0G9_9BACT|nr:hypothetical protein [Cystobacter fuscus]ATB37043.1 hypothetical protein CYFUS_002464 [Cystobacter fuscus]